MGQEKETDPFGIVPDGFREAWGAVTIPGALEIAERAPGTNPRASFTRCPSCRSASIIEKDGEHVRVNRKPESFKCRVCNHHFDNPLPPLEDRPIELLWAWFADDQQNPKIMFKTSDGIPDEEIETDFEWCNARALKDPANRRPVQAGLPEHVLTELAIRMAKPWSDERGETYEEIGETIGYSRQWVGYRIRAWKDGEHRELVEEPEEEPAVEPAPSGEPAVADGGRSSSRWAAYGGP